MCPKIGNEVINNKIATPKPFISFKPAAIAKSEKDFFVYYYALNPITNKLVRFKVRLNHIKDAKERKKYAKLLCLEINKRLYEGWNPYDEKLANAGQITLSQGIKRFLNEKSKTLREDSMRSYTSFCKIFLSFLENQKMADKFILQFPKEMAQRYINTIAERDDVSASGYNGYVRFMKMLWLYFIEKEYTSDNPFEKIKTKRTEEKKRTIIPPETRQTIKDWLFANGQTPYYYVCMMTYRLLIRPKETLMLKIGNIDFKRKQIIVPSNVAKNHHERILSVPDEIMDFLAPYEQLDKKLYIFSKNYLPDKKQLCTRDTGRTWDKMRKALNLPSEYQFYSLKDTAITELLERGVPAKIVQQLADHHSIEMTQKYMHRTAADEVMRQTDLNF